MTEREPDNQTQPQPPAPDAASASAETVELDRGHGALAPTLELPRTQDGAAVATPATPRKRHRLRNWLIALVAVVLVIVIAWIVGDLVARDYAKSYVRDQIISTFDLPADQPMDVEIGPGSLILQAIQGSIDSVDVDIPKVALGDIEGDVTLALTGIPLSATEPVDTLRVKLAVDEANVQNLSGYLSDADNITIALQKDEVEIGTTFTIFSLKVPVSVGLVPSAVDGAVAFEPTEFTVNDASVSLADLKSGPLAGVAGGLLSSQTYCIAEYLPMAITLTDVTVTDTDLVLSASGDGAALGGPEMTTLGTCG